MKFFPTSTRFRVRRGAVVAALLLLAFGVAVVLAIQAYGVARYHRAQADRVLRDYAALSAARVAQRSALDLYWYSILPVLKGLQQAHQNGPQRPLPLPKAMSLSAMERPYALQSSIRFSFRFDLLTKKLETAGQPISTATHAWLPDTLIAHTRTIYDTSWHQGAILGQPGGERHYVAYTVLRDKAGVLRTALGFDVDPASLRPVISSAIEKLPLLPAPLTGGVQYDSMGSIIITDRYGVELYRSAVQYTSPFTARDTLGTDMGDLYAHTTLRAEVADHLIIGGLPKSRLPLILVLLAVTAVLIGTALVQLRRESQLARLRSDFISGVSHELRTPLAQIRMFSETLTLGRVRSDDERRRSLAIIDQEARRLTHLVENLLHFSRSERQTTHITPEPTKLAPLVQEVIDGFAPLAAARGATLAASIPEDLIVPADPGAVRQMLLNLLDNAVKYGPAGQEVRIGASRENGAARLWVEDGGPGIPRADRERVWVRFWRLERDRDSAVAGSGIGLAVVRELASLHHGRAFIDETAPTAGAGTRVVIELPA
jgi:signal transduction histidine kinase